MQNSIVPKTIKDADKKSKIIGWLNVADNDYLSARILIDNGLLPQGAISSATAIEKYLKMIGEVHDIKFNMRGDRHNILDLYRSLKNSGATFQLSEDYLNLLVKIYKFRYPDKLESNFSFALNQSKLMAALDESVHILRNRVQFIDEKGVEQKNSAIHSMIEKGDTRLLRANHVFGSSKREDLFSKPSVWHEMRFLNGKTWLEARYTAMAKDDGAYNLTGMDQGQNEREFKLKSEPIDVK